MAEIERRRQRLRLPVKELAQRADCDPNTASHALRGKYDPRHGTAKRLSEALIAEEIRLRDALNLQHPQSSIVSTKVEQF